MQLLITDIDSASPARRIIVRPRRWLLMGLFLLLSAFALGIWAGRTSFDFNRLVFERKQLEHEKERLVDRLAEQQAKIELQQRTIDALREELRGVQQELADAKEELLFYQRVLAARKAAGVQIVDAVFRSEEKALRGRVALVKGGNVPRRLRVRLFVRAFSEDGTSLSLLGKEGMPLVLETHAVLAKRWALPEGFKLKACEVLVQDGRGRELARRRIELEEDE